MRKKIKINSEVAEKLKSELFEWDGEFYPKGVFEWKNPDDLYKLCINQQIEINRLRSENRTQRNRINVEKEEIRYLRNLNLRDEVRDLKKKIKIFEDYFIDNILSNCSYELKNIKDYSLDDYYVRRIICDFLEYGNFDYQYMIDKIKDYKAKKESDENESKKQ